MEERTKVVRCPAAKMVPKKPPASAMAAASLRQHEMGKEPGRSQTTWPLGLEAPRAPEERPSCRCHQGPPIVSSGR